MQIGLSSASFYPNVLTEESICLMKRLGFDMGEIFLNSPSEYKKEFADELKNITEKYNFKINSIHAFSSSFEPYLFDRYIRRKNDMLKYFKDVCKVCSILKAKCYTFHGMRKIDSGSTNNKFIVDVYNELAYIAGEYDIKLAQENVSWCMSSNLDFLHMLKEKCKYPIYFTLDIKQAHRANIEPLEYIKIMGKDLINFHINDRNLECDCLLPGKGEIEYNSIFEKLRQINYNGNLIIEVYRKNYLDYNEIEKSKKFLDKIISRK